MVFIIPSVRRSFLNLTVKNYENWSTFAEVIVKLNVARIFYTRGIAVGRCRVSVCLSVCHTRELYPNGLRYHKLLSRQDSPVILYFESKRRYATPRGTPSAEAFKFSGGKNL